jgi:hypothetical protein
MGHTNETLPIINKPKHPKEGEYKEQNGRIHMQEDKKTTQESKPQKEHQVLEPSPIVRSILNKEKGRPYERTFSLKELSPIATTCFKIETTYACYITTNTFCL